jgi:hypothetical protein
MIIFAEPPTERWLEIRGVHGDLITVLEVLRPSNKRDEGWKEYREKQRAYLASGVRFVEIDLSGGGLHAVAIDPD